MHVLLAIIILLGINMPEGITYTGNVICPLCGRRHRMKRLDGKLRKTIYCRCRNGYGHTVLYYDSGFGYNVLGKDMSLIPAGDEFIE